VVTETKLSSGGWCGVGERDEEEWEKGKEGKEEGGEGKR
jgi:hypothetical protein